MQTKYIKRSTGCNTAPTLGSNITTRTVYDDNGLLTELKSLKGSIGIRDYDYQFNPVSGTLGQRMQ
ncbi:MAG: hypothetical protein LBV41_07100 [Cytophagaceae bacterium]|jgi:hypothetical protein|nr:hypothetical protein [Cytophagaceae bacterium]